MKKIFSLALFCLCLLDTYGHEVKIPDGVYIFEKAELTICNYDTKEVVDHRVITDTASVDALDMHTASLFFSIEILNDELLECVLPDGKKYKLDELMKLQPAAPDRLNKTLLNMEEISDYLFVGQELFPHESKIEGKKLIVTFFKYNFGQSGIDYTMEAELVVNMIKKD